ncbi:hypothetical protein ACFOEW_21745 [Alteromonas oceani]|uniref:TIGR03016 family PEP-CTERM system-associated outer membrane protein n=1 Tax=Alteromonas oceani TaxID=2071609 RepID=A0ABV7K536_9ALTE|nr:hypothetical protein [Alteromonas oceani]
MERINIFRPAIIATLIGATFSANLHADVQFRGAVNSSLINQSFDTDSEDSRYQDRNVIQISPTLTGVYASKKANATASATQRYQRFDVDEGSRSSNFTEFNYAGNLNIIDNVFQIFGQGAQRYQSYRPETYVSSDYLLNSDDLSKITSHSAGARLNIPRGDVWGLSLTGLYFESESDDSLEEAEDNTNTFNRFIDSTGVSVNADLTNGDWFRNIYWNVTGSYRRTDRQDRGLFESVLVNGVIGFRVYGDLGLITTATHEENDIEGELANFSARFGAQFSKFDTYGIGFNYRPAAERFFRLTLNKVSTDGEDDGKTFVGVATSWQFSPRTNLQAQYSRRYYGEAGQFSLSHGTRRLRTTISYQERTTTFSNMIFDTVDAGTFVCPAGSVDIIDCFQPDTLDYELQPGEQVVQFSQVIPELTDQVILRRQLGGSIGYQQRRLKLVFDTRYVDSDYSVDNRQQIQRIVGLNASLQVGARSSVYSRIQFAKMDFTVNGESRDNNSRIYSIGLRSNLSRNLSVNADVRYLDGGGNQVLRRDAVDLNETRISLGLTYNFQSNRQ